MIDSGRAQPVAGSLPGCLSPRRPGAEADDHLQPLVLERVTALEPLREAVATYASRAGEKLRSQGDYGQRLQVYIRTGVFNPTERQYARTASVPLPYPTHDTRDLVRAALAGLEAIYQPGYRYQKAGGC